MNSKQRMDWTWLGGLLVILLALGTSQPSWAATVVINVQDSPGEGFNDPTSVSPVGGNTGTTLGEQRLIVLQHAADIWGGLLPSDVTIEMRAAFDPRPCDASGAVLASAGAVSVSANFTGAPLTNTWYHAALANKLAGVDLDPGNEDLSMGFNVDIDGNDNCLSGTDWYYGLDGNEGNDIEMLSVALHEIAHGLGFSTFTDLTTGGFLSATPDIYARQLFDNETNESWVDMMRNERRNSAKNTGHVVWSGSAVAAQAPFVLGGQPRLLVNSPGSIAGSYEIGLASFGAELTDIGVTADVVLVDDGTDPNSDACEPIQNGSEINGKIALIDRGTCTFVSKALAAQSEGAVGVIIIDNVVDTTPPGLGGTDPTVVIPVVSVTNAVGNDIKGELLGGVNATIGLDPSSLAGADDQGRVLLYAPDPVQGGSSISHWDLSANPNLLMEPFIEQSLSDDVDLTLGAFEDIGWMPTTTDVLASGHGAIKFRGGYPNPFGASTSIRFDLDREQFVQLSIYDAAGKLVRRLVAGSLMAGPHAVTWDGKNGNGSRLNPGVYFGVLRTTQGKASSQLVILR